MFILIAPKRIDDFNILHAGNFEGLVHPRRYLVAPHIIVIIHHQERFHITVAYSLAMRRRIIFQAPTCFILIAS